ncbi:hypothetical protein ZWY2020_057845 [Hordeum vulgare]|nr:hypothetical protein ZWY2020_057845 [Hordeum vulgare]
MDMTGSGYSDLHLLDATTGAREGASDDAGDNFLELFDGDQSTDDLFEVVRRGGGRGAMEVPPAASSFPMSPPQVPEMLPQPPSEEDMAAWIYPVVRDEEFAAGHPHGYGGVDASIMAVGDGQQVQSKNPSKRSTDKCNQASTLDQTIQYMKSLQQQVQSMSSVVGCSMRPTTVAAVYPLAPPLYIQPTAGAIAPRPPMLPPACAAAPAGMVMFAGPHHPAVMRPPFIHKPNAPSAGPAERYPSKGLR